MPRPSLRALSLRPTLHHEIAADVLFLLESEDARLRILACNSLGQLGSRVAVEALTRALDDRDDRVARTARTALRVILGPDAFEHINRTTESPRVTRR